MAHPATRHADRAAVALLVALAALVALPSVVSSAEAPAEALTIQSVDTSAYPKVVMRIVLPGEVPAAQRLRASDITLRENGTPIEKVTVRSLAAHRDPVLAVLAIDASGSMRGQAITDAKRAAKEFVAAMGRDDRVALVAFSETARTIHGFTGDKAALENAIDTLEPDGETALYDALVSAAGMLGADAGAENAIVLLSDGGDTVSASPIGAAADALGKAGVPLYAVALQTGEYNPTALESLSLGSGGRLTAVNESEQLASTFTEIAKQLQSPHEISFTSAQPPADDLQIELTVALPDGRAFAQTSVPNPGIAEAEATHAQAAPLPSRAWPFAIAGLTFAAVSSVTGVGLGLLVRQRSTLRQLGFYEQTGEPAMASGASGEYAEDSMRGRIMDAAGTVATRSGFTGIIAAELERSGLPLRPVEYMTLHTIGVVAAGLLVQLAGRNLALTVAAIVVFALGPVAWLRVLARKRLDAFEAQLPEVLNLLASSLRTGWGLLQAVGIVVGEMAAPAGPEFGRVVTEARLGLPVEKALEKMADRLNSVDFRWAVTAIAIQREVGGNLAEVLDIVAGTVRERGTLRRQISSLTAEGRLSAIILLALPFVETGLLLVVNPGYLTSLLSHPLGIIAIVSAIVLLIIGGIWLKSIVGIEV